MKYHFVCAVEKGTVCLCFSFTRDKSLNHGSFAMVFFFFFFFFLVIILNYHHKCITCFNLF